ncbi:MAG: metallophosphatase family protein [Candidatus Bathyarchaeota archaeon]|nr:metallophosphatase family protein [Candidatus Bathyarchaeota archaeon]
MDPLRLLVVSDIHSNHIALRAVLDDAAPWDRCICAGDTVGYGPDPNECIDALRDNGFRCIRGNHDHEVITGDASSPEGAPGNFRFNPRAARAIKINRGLLTPDSRAYLEGLPTSLRLKVDGVNIAVYHGSPRAPLSEYIMPEEAKMRAAQLIAESECTFLVLGHTHKPYAIEHGDALLLNPGSVGQPRDGDPRASYALVEIAEGKINSYIHRVKYDIKRTQEKMKRRGLPKTLATRLGRGR